MKLLLVEDDPSLRDTLARSLGRRGMAVSAFAEGRPALAHWQAEPPDVAVLDLSLPDIDGLDLLAQARRRGLDAPVLLLTARGTVGDRVLGLRAGADDYLPKPFDLDELEARLHALARRRPPPPAPAAPAAAPGAAAVGRLRHDRFGGGIYCGDRPMELTPRESSLLLALMHKPGHAVSKERLFELVFPGEAEVQYEAIEVVVYRLRKKLADTGTVLMTLRGLGYLLKAAP
ncbi:MAG: response regulator [Xylophilus ampelinus]